MSNMRETSKAITRSNKSNDFRKRKRTFLSRTCFGFAPSFITISVFSQLFLLSDAVSDGVGDRRENRREELVNRVLKNEIEIFLILI